MIAALVDRARRYRDYRRGLHARIVDLEHGLEEQRQLARRVAELTDLVTELLVPLADRDHETVADLVDRYRTRI